MIYPNGFVTLRKLEEMVDNPKDWIVFAENKITHEKHDIKDRNDLREYTFFNDYTIGYDFIGNWDDYTETIKPKDKQLYKWKKSNIEIHVNKKDDKINAEIVKWENNKPSAEDLPTCFILAYWNIDDLIFVGDKFFKYIPWYMVGTMYKKIKEVQKIVEKANEEE